MTERTQQIQDYAALERDYIALRAERDALLDTVKALRDALEETAQAGCTCYHPPQHGVRCPVTLAAPLLSQLKGES